MENNNSLPVVEIFFEALSLPRKYFSTLLRFGAPFIIVSTLWITISYFFPAQENPSKYETAFNIVVGLIYCISLVLAIVGCHRTFLLDHESISNTKIFRWSGRETRYVGWWVLIGLAAGLIALPFVLILMPEISDTLSNDTNNTLLTSVIIGSLNIPIYYVVSRWSLVLPATAIDKRHRTFLWSWGLSKGNGWRLTLLIGFLPFITDLVFSLLPDFKSIFYLFIIGSSWAVVGVIEIGLLSLSYAFLSENNKASNV